MKLVRVSSDHPALAQLHRRIMPSDRMPRWASGWWWLVTVDGEPIAFAGIQPSAQWGDTMYLCRSGVLPAHRGHGLQRRLIRVREAFARRTGMRWLITETYDNPPSANSLIGCGFRMFNPSSPWAGKGSLYWRKRIAS